MSAELESALYRGKVYHQRFVPTQHKFDYDIYLFWLKLSEIDQVSKTVRGFSVGKFNWVEFRRQDYYGDPSTPLESAIIDKMSELANIQLSGDVFMLGQVRTLGLYFSPVNFYYLRDSDKNYTHMLAEVSNTPWNDRHYYLVDLAQQADTDKVFHVSPFNPMDMTYKWRVAQPSEQLALALDCHKEDKHFAASIAMKKLTLNSNSLSNVLKSIPSMTLKTVWGIYWQALKLFVKRTPIYGHPGKSQEN